LFNKNNWTSFSSFLSNKSLIKKYIDWISPTTAEEGKTLSDYPPIYQLDLYDVDYLEKFRREYYRDANDFFGFLETVYSQDEPGYSTDANRYIMDKLYYSLYWELFKKETIIHFKKSDVNTDKGIVLFEEKEIIIDPRTNGYIKTALEVDGYMSAIGKDGNLRVRRYAKNNMLIRNTSKNFDRIDEPVKESTLIGYSSTNSKLAKNIKRDSPYYGKRISARGIVNTKFHIKQLKEVRDTFKKGERIDIKLMIQKELDKEKYKDLTQEQLMRLRTVVRESWLEFLFWIAVYHPEMTRPRGENGEG
ncbi:hypothetical protein LJC04_06020, partial [Ruminococcaceae bacterium OttesenSCG-928-O06]|nr:hypothetical protein [Ruminococcaceae bacterium OttesenSCG-928-O06]